MTVQWVYKLIKMSALFIPCTSQSRGPAGRIGDGLVEDQAVSKQRVIGETAHLSQNWSIRIDVLTACNGG
jgi:hypothetical protein